MRIVTIVSNKSGNGNTTSINGEVLQDGIRVLKVEIARLVVMLRAIALALGKVMDIAGKGKV